MTKRNRILCLMLSLLLLLTGVSLTAFQSLAEDGGGASGEMTSDVKTEKTAAELTAEYASLYAKGATTLLMTYYADGDGTLTLENGNGTWKNLVEGGADVSVTGVLRQIGGHTKTFVSTSTVNAAGYVERVAYEFHTIEYEDGVPVALRTVSLYQAKKDGAPYISAATEAIKINGETIYLTRSVARYREILPSNGEKLYIKTEKARYTGRAKETVGSQSKYVPAYTTGAGNETWTFLTDEPTEGYTLLGNYEIGDDITKSVGGWEYENGGLSVSYNDIAVTKGVNDSRIDLGTMETLFGIGEKSDYDYTLEIVAKYTDFTDEDHFIFSASQTVYEGESTFKYGNAIGAWREYVTVFPSKFTGYSGGFSAAYVSWCYGSKADAQLQNPSARVCGFSTQGNQSTMQLAYTKNSSNRFSVLVDGASKGSFVAGTTKHSDGTVTEYDGLLPTDTAHAMWGMSGTVYAVRAYTRVLTADELAANRFVDLCAFYGADVSELLAIEDEAERNDTLASLGAAAKTLTFENASRKAVEDLIASVIYDEAERARTEQYASLYAEGATAILLAYNAKNDDGTILLSGGSGAWENLVNGEQYTLYGVNAAYTVGGESVTAGWQINQNGSIGYRTSYQLASKKQSHYLALPASLLGNGHNTTVELVAMQKKLDIADGASYAANSTLTQLSTTLGAKNYVQLHIYEQKYTASLKSLVTKDAYLDYNNFGRWDNKSRATINVAAYDDKTALRMVVTGAPAADGKVSVSTAFYTDAKAAVKSSKFSIAQPTASASSMVVLQDVPAELYAVRTYDRTLTDIELKQNHFADLCAYYGLDMTLFLTYVPAQYRAPIYEQWASYTFTSHTKEALQAELDLSISATFLRFDGFAVKTEGEDNELAAVFTVNETEIRRYEEMGFTLEYGVMMAKYADISSIGELFVGETSDKILTYKLYGSDGSGERKYVSESDTEKVFGCSVFYDRYTTPSNLASDYCFRSYIRLTTPGGETIDAYTDATADYFGNHASLYDVIKYLKLYVTAHAENGKFADMMENIYVDCDIFVDPVNGNDKNGGESRTDALKTVAEAAKRIDALLLPDGAPLNLTLRLLSGEHFTDEVLALDGKDYQREYKLVIEGEDATLSGAYELPLSSFTPSDGGILTHAIPSQYKDRVFRSLYADGRLATLATTEEFRSHRVMTYFTEEIPEGGTRKFADAAYLNESSNIYFVVYVDRTVIEKYIPAEQLEARDVDIAGMEFWTKLNWDYMGFRVVDIDFDHSLGIFATPDIGSKNPTNKNYENMYALVLDYSDASTYNKFSGGVMKPQHIITGAHCMATLKNSKYLIDEPGEYCYELDEGALYYLPKAGETSVGLSTLEQLISLKNMANVTVRALTLTGTTNNSPTTDGYIHAQAGNSNKTSRFSPEAAIYFEGVENLSIDGCEFYHLFGSGIVGRGVNRDIAIMNNCFENIGASAIIIGDPADWNATKNALTDATVENNYMHDIATVFLSNCAVTITKAKNLSVCYNSIVNCSYTGISVGWGWGSTNAAYGTFTNVVNAEIAYNYVENYMHSLFDGGAIYTLGGNATIKYTEAINTLHDNYAYCASYEGRPVCKVTSTCWYHDGASSHWYTYNNVVWVNTDYISEFCYLSLQGYDEWNDTMGQQVYNITLENNYFINLYQDYLTVGYGRVKDSKNIVEKDSYLLTGDDIYSIAQELEDTFIMGGNDRHGDPMEDYMLVDPDAFDFTEPSMADEINAIITKAGADRQKGRELPELYEYLYKKVENPGSPF